jgi:hypothetical protein
MPSNYNSNLGTKARKKRAKTYSNRRELNIGPATPIGRGSQPLDPRAHRVARDIVGTVASMGGLGIARGIGQAARFSGDFLKPTRAAWRAAGVPMRDVPRGIRALTLKRKK